MNEWEFTGEVKEWIGKILEHNPDLPFSTARLEQRGTGSKKRRDLTLLGKDKLPLLTGEIKLPYASDGNTPYRSEVVADARDKAKKANVVYFFTWNVNECVLWETASSGAGLADRTFERWKVTHVTKPEHLEQEPTRDALYKWLVQFLHDVAKILRGKVTIGQRSPDTKFVEALEAALALPIRFTFEELAVRYSNATFKRDLDAWMRELGWTIVDDADGVRENLERAAKFSCYLLVNKLVFHEALLKKYGKKLDPLKAPPEITKGDELRVRLEGFFQDAKEITGDYETIFGEDPTRIANRIPFYADAGVNSWRGLIEQIHEFDFSRLDYEVVGAIFERLISPEERHKYGQYYTRVEVVDLINSFCIRSGNAKILDPACGGGTFLVRAYARKRELAANRKHKDLLTDIFGIDISQFAAHLTTMNLATRDLVEDENYPRIGREDFFNVLPNQAFVHLPQKLVAKGLGTLTEAPVSIPPLDAVITNPPYVRQEEIRKAQKSHKEGGPEPGTKQFYAKRIRNLAGVNLSGRSDLHCYFWPHAAQFLKDDGLLGFITSSQWLDVEYGFQLQKWLLQNFEIVAVIESTAEPWFVGARVATTVTIARRCRDEAQRNANTVRFIQLLRPLSEIIEHDGTTIGAVHAADVFRDEILALDSNVSNKRFRSRLVRQAKLWNDGVALGRMGAAASNAESEEEDDPESTTLNQGDYLGGKWGVYVRAPDLWFELLDKFGAQLTPLGEIAEIRRGITSGKDAFFFPQNCSDDCLTKFTDPTTFEHEYGVPRSLVEKGEVRLVMAGEKRGEIKSIEAKYLEPELHSLMEIKGFKVRPEDCSRLILLVGEPKRNLKRTYVKEYIAWGESQGFHLGATCQARITPDRDWYDITNHPRGELFWPKTQQYKHTIPINDANLQCNCNLYDLFPSDEIEPKLLAGILNSSLTVLSKHQYGRPVGNEGALKTEVVDVTMMQVVLPLGPKGAKKRVIEAFDELAKRDALKFIPERRMREMAYGRAGREAELQELSDHCELDMSDRRALDHAVFELLGVRSERERNVWIDRLYAYLRYFFEQVRRKEELAIGNKNVSKRKGAVSPQDLAQKIYTNFHDNEPRWLRPYREFFRDVIGDKHFESYEAPRDGDAKVRADMVSVGVEFLRGAKMIGLTSTKLHEHAELLALVANEDRRDVIRVPSDPLTCKKLTSTYASFLRDRNHRLRESVAERVADEDIQQKVYDLILGRFRAAE